MDTIFGFIGLALWIAGTIGIAAGITWVVVKVSPGNEDLKPKSQPEAR
jgi:hypothetical protein